MRPLDSRAACGDVMMGGQCERMEGRKMGGEGGEGKEGESEDGRRRTQPAFHPVATASQVSVMPNATVTPALTRAVRVVSFVSGGPASLR